MRRSKHQVLGQHFLIDQRYILRLIDIADISSNDKVFEIGTGYGVLTKHLAEKCNSVTSIEKDKDIFNEALRDLQRFENIRLQLGDAFEFRDYGFDCVVTSLPYSMSSKFISWLAGQGSERTVAILQEDFVQKITSKPGTKKYGANSVLTQLCFIPSVYDRVPPSAFIPAPKVFSRIVRLDRICSLINWSDITKMLKIVFSFRGKLVRSIFRRFDIDDVFIDSCVQNKRVEELSPIEAYHLAIKINKVSRM